MAGSATAALGKTTYKRWEGEEPVETHWGVVLDARVPHGRVGVHLVVTRIGPARCYLHAVATGQLGPEDDLVALVWVGEASSRLALTRQFPEAGVFLDTDSFFVSLELRFAAAAVL